eukprot:2483141-Amphidinium_carterae.1
MAKLRDKVPEFADCVPKLMAVAEYSTFNEQALSNALWAAASVSLDTQQIKPIAAAVVDRMSTNADKFIEQHLSNILWAAAKVGLDTKEIQPIVTAVVGRMRTDADKFKEQEMSNILWSAAKLGLDKQEIQ